ncbi:MAG TPA: choice-of-anchor Q domain-containing protein [Blastocatellia bacterium]|nr:choice-of-anchor Q domain-containing protein [Blastocatellia bacterium]
MTPRLYWLLGSLQNNGGPSSTLALLPGSPAINNGIAGATTTDQRGVTRPQGSGIDSGAYELRSPLDSSVSVGTSGSPSNNGDSVTFTATVSAVGVSGTPTGTVQFKDNGTSLGSPVSLSSGAAALTTAALTGGTHTIAAFYNGDDTFDPSSGTVSQTVNDPTPATTGLSPNSATSGSGAFTLTVNGTSFVNGEVVRWNGSNRTTTFISSTQLQAAILASDLSTVGPASVTVFDPAFTVTSNAQTFTVNPILVTNLNDSGTGSLRAALSTVTSGGVIGFQAGLIGTIHLASALPINTGCTITGPGASLITIDGGNAVQIFSVSASPFSISGLTIANGFDNGGFGGGAFSTTGTVSVDSCVFSHNTTTKSGGAIFNFASTLNVSNSTFIGNTAQTDMGGAISNLGNSSQATLTITNSTFTQNSGTFGGAIGNQSLTGSGKGVVTITNSTVSGNSATAGDGGIYSATLSSATASVTVLNCTIANNTAPSGAGIENDKATGTPTFNVKNTIISGNTPVNVATVNGATITSQGNNIISDNPATGFTASGDKKNTNPLLGPLQSNGGPTQTMALLQGSPAIDAGNNTGAPATDQRGVTRPQNGTVDIGAYELRNPINSSTSVITSGSPSNGGDSVTFTATVSPVGTSGTPTGAVQFLDNGSNLGSPVPLVNGVAALTTTQVGSGTRTITAAYAGDSTFDPSSGTVTQVVIPQTFVVTTNADSGTGSLRDIYTAAPDGSIITFGINGTITFLSKITITKNIVIQGPGVSVVTLSGGGATNLFEVDSGSLTISGLTLANGFNTAGDGGAIFNNAATVSVSNCVFSNNAVNSSSFLFGGAISNELASTLTVDQSTFINNHADGGEGGAIFNSGRTGLSTATITNSTFTGNSSPFGGAIENEGDSGTANLILTNCTITGNSAASEGGGLDNHAGQSTATSTLLNVTIANNTAPGGNAVSDSGSFTNTVTAKNSIFKGSSGFVFSGTVNSLGNNIVSDTTSGFAGSGDKTNTDPLLGPLQNHGGPTQTMALLAGSPAIDAGNNTGAPATDQRGIARPQNGIVDIGAYEFRAPNSTTGVITSASPITAGTSVTFTATVSSTGPAATPTGTVQFLDNGVNLGSPITLVNGVASLTTSSVGLGTRTITAQYNGDVNFETSSGTVTEQVTGISFVVTSTADSGPGTLRDIYNATPTGAQITFAVTGTITLLSPITITGDVIIQGPGINVVTLSGGGTTNLFVVNSGTTTISGLTLANGFNNTTGGAAIFNNGAAVNISNCLFSNNHAQTVSNSVNGAAIANVSGVLTIDQTTFSNNATGPVNVGAEGGAIYNFGNTTPATATITNSTFNNNSADFGGAIGNLGGGAVATLSLTNCTISGNAATTSAFSSAGGIDQFSAGSDTSVTLVNTTFANNTAPPASGSANNISSFSSTGTSTVNSRNSIFSGSPSAPNFTGVPVTSQGNNLSTDSPSGFVASDKVNTNPLLGPLQNNGGPTFTQALLPGSPAIDAGSTSGAPTTDQRGVTRPQNGTVDIGAYEVRATSNSSTSVITSGSPSNGGSPVTFTATVVAVGTSGTPTGFVQFEDNGVALGAPVAMVNGVAALTTSGVAGGTRTITAVYEGDPTFDPSSGTVTQQVINPTPVTSGLNPSSVLVGSGDFTLTVLGSSFANGNVVQINGSGRATTFIDSTHLQATILGSDITSQGTATVTVFEPSIPATSNPQALTINNIYTVINTNDDGPGSLRFGLGLVPAGGTINFDPSVTGSIQTLSTLSISNSYTINGPGANVLTIDGINFFGRIFTVTANGATLSGLTIANGIMSSGGGLSNNGHTVTINSCVFSGNQANGTTGGGAIVNNGGGTMTINDSTFISNSSSTQGGAIVNSGSTATTTLTINRSTFTGNSAATGGAIINVTSGRSATLNMTNCTVTGNTSSGNTTGAGIDNSAVTSAQTASTTLTNCTIAGNSASGTSVAGGIRNRKGSGTATFNVKNSIISGNSTPNALVSGTSVVFTSSGNNVLSDSQANFNATGDKINTDPLLDSLRNNGGLTTTMALLPGSPAIDNGNNTGAPATDQRGVARPQGAKVDSGAYEFRANSAISIGSSLNPSTNGQNVTLTATVTPIGTAGTPGGSVQFSDGGTPIGIANVTAGTATFSTTALSIGSHSINALYLGDGTTFDDSISNTIPQQVNSAPPAITRISPSFSGPGGPDFTLTVNGTGFVNGDSVNWNGSSRTTTFISNTQLQAQILAADIASNSTNSVTVFDSAQNAISNAATFTVGDTVHVTTLADDGPGSLREAVTLVPSGGNIVFDVTGTITLHSMINIFTPCLINGPGASQLMIHGDGTTGLFGLNASPITFSNLTFDGGHASSLGGGGAMLNNSNVINIDNCVFSNNSVSGSGNAGGAIANYLGGTFNITNTTFINNTAPTSKGGAIYSQGAISGATLNITGSTFTQNSASRGGAIYNETFNGGFNVTLTMTNCTISGNSSTSTSSAVTAGAIVNTVSNGSGTGTATATLINCTLANNTAAGTGTANSITNRTVAGGIATFNVLNTIITGASPTVTTSGTTFTSQGNNILSDSPSDFNASGDKVNTDPLLGILQSNGGPTQTHALLPGSPAIDAGNNSGAPATDQRGVTRPVNPTVDIGAFENLINLSPSTLGLIVVGVPVNQTISAMGGTPGYSFAFTGTLPTGLSLSSGGVLSGNPTASGSFDFTVTATDSSGFSGSRPYTVVVDNAPTATVNLNTGSPLTNDTLTATATSSDADGQLVSLTYVWKKNGSTILRTVTKNTGTNADLTDSLDLSGAGNGDKGDLITVEVTPNDGLINGAIATASATVANTAPTATVNLNTNSPQTKDTLTATATSADADSDTVFLTYVWKVNGVLRRTTTTNALTDTFDVSQSGNGDRGDTITVEVTPNDGIIDGSIVSASATVADSAPTDISLSNSSIAENNPVGTTLGTFTTTDPDSGDTQTYSLVSGTGSDDNALFTISGNALMTNAFFDAIVKSSYSIRVSSTDQDGLSFEKVFTITITSHRAPIVVNTLLDTIADDGQCTLREAIQLTNTHIPVSATSGECVLDTSNPAHITFSVSGTVTLQTALPAIDSNVSIDGPTANALKIQRLSGSISIPSFSVFTVNSGPTAAISNLTISGGDSVNGGGINNAGNLTVSNSTVTANNASSGGGGLSNSGTLTISNSTVSGNSGGGIFNTGTLAVSSSTITSNIGGGVVHNKGTASIGNTIIAGNNGPLDSPDIKGDFTSQGHNLIGKGDGGTGFTNGSNGDLVGTVASPVDPRLGPLADNGGPTFTHALLVGSPAFDAGSVGGPTTDQRGFARGIPDIGAYEAQPWISAIPDQRTPINTSASVNFTIGDTAITNPAISSVVATSSNQSVVADGNLIITGSGGNQTLTVTPASNQTGATTITVTVAAGNSTMSTSFIFTVDPAGTCTSDTATVDPSSSGSISTLTNGCGSTVVMATLTRDASGAGTAYLYGATYNSNPSGVSIFDVGGGFIDLRVTNPGATDSVTANFYYPPTIVDPNESNLKLFFFNGSGWQIVKSSGGIDPVKNTTDNLDGTTSGGRITVVFDSTSSPMLSQLTGTIFTMSTVSTPTAVDFNSATVTNTANSNVIEWTTGMEVNNLGFNIYREAGGERVKVNPSLIAGTALMVGGNVRVEAGNGYAWIDNNAGANASYWIEDVDLNGTSVWHGPFGVTASSGASSLRSRSTLISELNRSISSQDDSTRQTGYPAGFNLISNPTGSALSVTNGRSPSRPAPIPVSLQKQWSITSRSAIKIAINKTGWYHLNMADLMEAGLDSGANPQTLQMFVGATEIPIRVTSANPGTLSATDSVEFYGPAIDTPTSNTQIYWLVSGIQSGKRIGTQQSPGASNNTGPGSFLYTVERKDRTLYFSSLLNGDQENWFGPIVSTTAAQQSVTVDHLDKNSTAQASIEIALQGVTTNGHNVKLMLNGSAVENITFNGMAHNTTMLAIPQSSLIEGNNEISIVALNSGDVSLVDYVRITYAHTYTANNNSLFTTVPASQPVQMNGFTSDQIRAIDVANPNQPIEVEGTIGGESGDYSVSFGPAMQRNLLVFTPDQMMSPLSITANQPSTLNKSVGANFVIITYKNFAQSIQPFVAFKQSQGYSVAVVDVEDIYDEFSYGVHSSYAVKDFLNWSYLHWPKQPQYVLLAASASLDPKGYEGLGNQDFIPTKLIDTSSMETASDDWLVDFDNDGRPQMSIGRLPVRTAADASSLVNKIIAYEQSGKAQAAVLVSDISDNADFNRPNNQIKALIPSQMNVVSIVRGQTTTDAKTDLLDQLSQGDRIVNYEGHGSVNLWRGNLLTSNDVPALQNKRVAPLIVTMTCLNAYFMDPRATSLGEALIRVQNGGSASVWASTSMTDTGNQAVMNQAFFNQIFSNANITIGQAIRNAKSAESDNDVRRTWVLFGDPTMIIKR